MDRTQLLTNMRSNLTGLGRGNLGVPVLLLVILGMMTLPVPPFLLDVLFTFNIALSIVVLLVCVYAMRPLDFAVFPTILLVATLLRLALNVASTRGRLRPRMRPCAYFRTAAFPRSTRETRRC